MTKEPSAKEVQAELWTICERAVAALQERKQEALPFSETKIEEQRVPVNEAKVELSSAIWSSCEPVEHALFDIKPEHHRQLDIIRRYKAITGGPDIRSQEAVVRCFDPATGELVGVVDASKPLPKDVLACADDGEAFLQRRIPWSDHRIYDDQVALGFYPFSWISHMAIVDNIRSLVRTCFNAHRMQMIQKYGGLVTLCYPKKHPEVLQRVPWPDDVTLLVKPEVAEDLRPLKLMVKTEILT